MRVKPTPSCSAVSDQPPMMSPEGLVRAKRISAAPDTATSTPSSHFGKRRTTRA